MFNKIKKYIWQKNRNKYRSYFCDDFDMINARFVDINNKLTYFNNCINDINAKTSNMNYLNNYLSSLNYKKTFDSLYNIISEPINYHLTSYNSVTFLNSTYEDYHHGCTATSLVIENKLKDVFKHVDILPIRKVKTIREGLIETKQFDNNQLLKDLENKYADIFDTLKRNDSVVINGEGCLSHYNDDTVMLLYLIYISKVKYHKSVFLINTSICNSDFVEKVSLSDRNQLDILFKKVLSKIDYLTVREQISYSYVKGLGLNNVYQAFDSLPIYVHNYYKRTNNHRKNYILISGGNDIVKHDINKVVELINYVKYYYPTAKIYYLLSNVANGICNDDEIFYNQLNLCDNSVKKLTANSVDEWLTYIKDAHVFISGRFHHSIAAFVLGTNFITFNTNTYKMLGMLNLIGKINNLITSDKEITFGRVSQIINNYDLIKDNMVKRGIISLAERNYGFMNNKKEDD